jgi:uncharacterized membrane protein YphA (DoxX/SURF4 family)
MKVVRNISRIILGLVFMFSGFVKAVDPMGSQFKFTDYFSALGMDFFIPAAFAFGFILFTVEFFLGVCFFFNIKVKQMSWLMMLFMLFFTILTLWLAITNKVTDCGCFGDAIVLSNWDTFYKNLILIVLALVVFFTRKKFVNNFHPGLQLGLAVIGLGFILSIAIYSVRHLPLIDFMAWKKGANISQQLLPTPEIADIKLVYKNKTTGELLEYTSKTLPWQDTNFMKTIEFVDQKKTIIQEFREAPVHDFSIDDTAKVSRNQEIIGNPSWQFLLVTYELETTQKSCFTEINALASACQKDSISFVGLTGSDWQTIDYFRHDVKATFEYFTVDKTALKSVVRSNPGLVLLYQGIVVDKWAWRDIPTWEEFKASQKEYMDYAAKRLEETKSADQKKPVAKPEAPKTDTAAQAK